MPGKSFRKTWLYFILVISMLFMIIVPATAAIRPVETQSVLIGFNNFPQAAEYGLLRAHNAKVVKQYTIIPAMLIEVPVQAMEGLKRNPLVDYVEADAPVYAVEQTVDWGVTRVKAPEVWNLASGPVTGNGVKVAVLDTGIGPHEDLTVADRVNFVSGSTDSDVNGHGTHVAGTIAALDNDIGVKGVAYDADLYAVKVLDDSGSGSISQVVSGIEWAVTNNMDIINMSLGSSSSSQALEDACIAAYNSGLLLVAAAGNSGNRRGTGNNVSYPARYESVIAVAATDKNNERAYFSSTGPAVELSAPGVSIYSTYNNNSYASLSGTSMASPHVAGVAALVKSANTGLTNLNIREILRSTATNLNMPDSHGGYGLVNALAAVQAALTTQEPVQDPYTVSGIVYGNGVALLGATVTDGQVSSTTDEFGYYSLQLYGGEHSLTASAPGYSNQTKTITVSDDTTVNFELTQSTQALMTNTIEFSTKSYGPFNDLSVTVRVVSGDLPVAGAAVNLELTLDGGVLGTFDGTTDSEGAVTFTLKKVASGTYTATVKSITHTSYEWDSGSTLSEPSDSFTIN